MKVFILAGGSGTRLWPLSKPDFPKQFLRICEDRSFFQKTLLRVLKVTSPENIVVITSKNYESLIIKDMQELGIQESFCNLVFEPVGKNTAPAIALGIKYCMDKLKCSHDEVIISMPSDHVIEPSDVFANYLKQAEQVAKEGFIVTFGVKPTRPETGYGYIKVSSKDGIYRDFAVFDVERFVEKPDLETAKKFLQEGNYYWNSGIFAFNIGKIVEELKKHAPEIASCLDKNFEEFLDSFSQMPFISIDYAVMEKAKDIKMIPMDIYWNDVGSWKSLLDILEKDEYGNSVIGNAMTLDTRRSVVIGKEKLVVTVGLDDVLVVESDNVVVVLKKDRLHEIMDVGNKIQRRHE